MEPENLNEIEGAVRAFAAAFGRKLEDGTKGQYLRVFAPLGKERMSRLFNWAVETLDSPLPTIARLRQRAIELGWLLADRPSGGNCTDSGEMRHRRREEPWFVRVTCPKCQGEFVVRKPKLLQDAREEVVYRCINGQHWGCPKTFRAADIQNLQLKEEV